jgi:hypothetical protein
MIDHEDGQYKMLYKDLVNVCNIQHKRVIFDIDLKWDRIISQRKE